MSTTLLRTLRPLASAALFAAMLGTGACGNEGTTGPGNGEEAGYTPCGDTTCNPGQYCWADDICEPGCTSSANCTNSESCEIDADGVGSCVAADGPPAGDDDDDDDDDNGDNPLALCEDACVRYGECGLPPMEVAQCIDDCAFLTASQQEGVAACSSNSCVSMAECLGVDCLSDDDCGGNKTCLDYTCL